MGAVETNHDTKDEREFLVASRRITAGQKSITLISNVSSGAKGHGAFLLIRPAPRLFTVVVHYEKSHFKERVVLETKV